MQFNFFFLTQKTQFDRRFKSHIIDLKTLYILFVDLRMKLCQTERNRILKCCVRGTLRRISYIHTGLSFHSTRHASTCKYISFFPFTSTITSSITCRVITVCCWLTQQIKCALTQPFNSFHQNNNHEQENKSRKYTSNAHCKNKDSVIY